MRAWLMDSYDGVENSHLAEVPDPKCGPGQVILKNHFAALNPADAFLAKGQYPAKPKMPHVLGRDGVGEIVEVAPDVKDWRVGDTAGILRCDVGVEVWGTLAEKTAVPAASLARVPQGWRQEEMAAAPLVFLTAWQALTQWSEPEGPPAPGSVVLITGASGGVGVASVLLGKSMGLTVVALSRSHEKAARLKELGADFTCDPADPNWRKSLKSALAGRGVDIAVDNVGGSLFADVIATLAFRGRVSVVGRSSGPVPDFNTGTLFFRRLRIGGVAVADFTPESAQETWKEMVARLDKIGRRPVVDHVFQFKEVPSAFARLAEGPMGKVLVRVGGSV
jgi:NADPH2:quinone reductase